MKTVDAFPVDDSHHLENSLSAVVEVGEAGRKVTETNDSPPPPPPTPQTPASSSQMLLTQSLNRICVIYIDITFHAAEIMFPKSGCT